MVKDICPLLGFTHSANAARSCDPEDRGTHTVPTPGGPQATTIVNESGLYALILGSKKVEAKAFKKWVTSVVLPAIRKDGAYVMGEEKVCTIEFPTWWANLAGIHSRPRPRPPRDRHRRHPLVHREGRLWCSIPVQHFGCATACGG